MRGAPDAGRRGARGLPPLRDLLAVIGVAAAQGLYFHWAFFRNPYLFHNNWRQSPHWISAARNSYQLDDLLVRYAEFNTAPFENLLYKLLGGLGPDILWGKINAIVFYAITAAIVYAAGHALRGRFGGVVAAAIFLFLPTNFNLFVGGFSSGMSMPLLCLAIVCVYRERWWAFVPLMAAQVFVYPMVAIHTGIYLIVDTAAHDLRRLRDPLLWKRKLVPLGLAALILALALFGKYAASHDYGHLTDRAEIGDRAEFGRAGRAKLLPVVGFDFQLRKYAADPFHLVLFSAAFLMLGRRALRLPRGLGSLLVASALLYWLSDLLLMRLYYPNRYVMRSFPLILALAGACWVGDIRTVAAAPLATIVPAFTAFRRLGRIPVWAGIVAILVLVGGLTFPESLRPPGGEGAGGNLFDRYGIYDAIRALPGRPMIAAPPTRASELPIITGKSVFISKELSHPWWSDYWTECVRRTEEFFRGYYTDDPGVLRQVIRDNAIDYWLVDRKDFLDGKRKASRGYQAPFDTWIAANFPTDRRSLLASVPREFIHWSDKRYFLVASQDLLASLDARDDVRGR